MGCIYNNWDGECSMYEEGHCNNPEGCQDDGFCVTDEDPFPADSCSQYESDSKCIDCGADLNVEECTCDDS